MRRYKLSFYLASFFLVFLCIVGLFAPLIAPHDPYFVNISDKLITHSSNYLLGTDPLGRDVLSRLIYGARLSLSISIIITCLVLAVSFPIGLWTGWKEGRTNKIFDYVSNIIFAFPSFMLSMSLVGIIGAGVRNMVIAITVVEWVYYAKILRNSVLKQKQMDYVVYAKLRGFSDWYIIRKHIIPFVYKPILVTTLMNIGGIILMISSFSFLGIGVQPSVPEWGNMINDSKAYFRYYSYLMLYPGLMIMFTVSSLNIIAHNIEGKVLKK